jgi:hypothetical protein
MVNDNPRRRAMFLSAALFNWSAAVAVFLLCRFSPGPFGLAPMRGSDLLFVDLACLLIALLGFGYRLAALKFERNRSLVALSACGKIIFFSIVALHYLSGHIGILLVAMAAGDLVYAALFFHFLRQPVPNVQETFS